MKIIFDVDGIISLNHTDQSTQKKAYTFSTSITPKDEIYMLDISLFEMLTMASRKIENLTKFLVLTNFIQKNSVLSSLFLH